MKAIMKAFLIGLTVVCLLAPVRSASAQDIEAECAKMRDKVACVCALQNGGQVVQPGSYKRQGWRFLRREAKQPGEPPDRERIAFPAPPPPAKLMICLQSTIRFQLSY